MAKHRLLLISVAIAFVGLASLPFLMSASCLTRQQLPAEQQALDTLRSMTRNDVLPSEDVVAKLETQFPRTKTAALARLVRARIKLNARDFAGAATLLDTKLIAEHTSLADHTLFLRANALEQTGKTAEARAVYQQLMQEYPGSLRAREAALRAADLLAKNGETAAVPLLLKDLNEQNDPAALLASGAVRRHIAVTSRDYAHRRRLVQAALGDLPGARLSGLDGGLHAVIEFDAAGTSDAVVARLADAGIAVARLADYSVVPGDECEGIVFGYASPSDTLLAEALTRMHGTILDAGAGTR